MDIGGGSTEFIIGNESEILWKHSFDFGSTALTSGMEIKDGLSEKNIQEINTKLDHYLTPLFIELEKLHPVSFIGTTGAFESFAHIIESNNWNNSKINSGYQFKKEDLLNTLNQLISSSKKSRNQNQSIHPLRVETIHIAAFILNFVLQKMTISNLYLSLGDVKEGLVLEYLQSEK